MTENELLKQWKSKEKGNLINEITKIIKGRAGYNCDHCERQYDDDICDSCLGVLLVKRFEDSLIKTTKEPTQ